MGLLQIAQNNDIIQDKNKIIGMIINNENIVSLLNPKNISSPSDLVYTYVFPYLKLPKTEDEIKNYITMKFKTNSYLESNTIYKDYTLTLCAVVHEDEMKTNYGGTRIDMISAELQNIFAWNRCLGFRLIPASENEDILDNKYYIRQITFETLTPNAMKHGVKFND